MLYMKHRLQLIFLIIIVGKNKHCARRKLLTIYGVLVQLPNKVCTIKLYGQIQSN